MGNSRMETYSPNLRIMPVYNGMYSHERRPAMISGVEIGQQSAMGISPPGAHENSFDAWFVLRVFPL